MVEKVDEAVVLQTMEVSGMPRESIEAVIVSLQASGTKPTADAVMRCFPDR